MGALLLLMAARQGEILWTSETGPMDFVAAVGDVAVFFERPTFNRPKTPTKLHAWDVKTGERKWSADTPDLDYASHGQRFWLPLGDFWLYYSHEKSPGSMRVLDARTGIVREVVGEEGDVLLADAGRILASSESGIRCLDPEGKELFRWKAGGVHASLPRVGPDGLYVTRVGEVVKVGFTGKQAWGKPYPKDWGDTTIRANCVLGDRFVVASDLGIAIYNTKTGALAKELRFDKMPNKTYVSALNGLAAAAGEANERVVIYAAMGYRMEGESTKHLLDGMLFLNVAAGKFGPFVEGADRILSLHGDAVRVYEQEISGHSRERLVSIKSGKTLKKWELEKTMTAAGDGKVASVVVDPSAGAVDIVVQSIPGLEEVGRWPLGEDEWRSRVVAEFPADPARALVSCRIGRYAGGFWALVRHKLSVIPDGAAEPIPLELPGFTEADPAEVGGVMLVSCRGKGKELLAAVKLAP